MSGKHRGPKSKFPTTDLGIFIQKRLDVMNMTRAELAKRLHVSPSTIVRMLNGDTKVIQQVRPESLCEALELDKVNRREFLKIVSATGFALATGSIAPKTIVRSRIDLDFADDHLKALQHLLDQGGQERFVVESAQRWYNTLLQEYPETGDARIARTQLHSGLLLGNALELVLPWNQRPSAIQMYKAIEENILLRFSLNTFQEEYAILLSHRAPRYRELGDHTKSRQEYEDAIDLVQKINNLSLRITLFRLRIHNYAILGDEIKWRRLLDEAYRDVQNLNEAYREGTLAMLQYVEAEGYKRLAFDSQKELPRQKRREYIQKSLQSFRLSQEAIERNIESHRLVMQMTTEKSPMAHRYLAQISEAQSLILIDPEETIRRIEQAWTGASRFYPALVSKLEITLHFAQSQLSASKLNPLLLFKALYPLG